MLLKSINIFLILSSVGYYHPPQRSTNSSSKIAPFPPKRLVSYNVLLGDTTPFPPSKTRDQIGPPQTANSDTHVDGPKDEHSKIFDKSHIPKLLQVRKHSQSQKSVTEKLVNETVSLKEQQVESATEHHNVSVNLRNDSSSKIGKVDSHQSSKRLLLENKASYSLKDEQMKASVGHSKVKANSSTTKMVQYLEHRYNQIPRDLLLVNETIVSRKEDHLKLSTNKLLGTIKDKNRTMSVESPMINRTAISPKNNHTLINKQVSSFRLNGSRHKSAGITEPAKQPKFTTLTMVNKTTSYSERKSKKHYQVNAGFVNVASTNRTQKGPVHYGQKTFLPSTGMNRTEDSVRRKDIQVQETFLQPNRNVSLHIVTNTAAETQVNRSNNDSDHEHTMNSSRGSSFETKYFTRVRPNQSDPDSDSEENAKIIQEAANLLKQRKGSSYIVTNDRHLKKIKDKLRHIGSISLAIANHLKNKTSKTGVLNDSHKRLLKEFFTQHSKSALVRIADRLTKFGLATLEKGNAVEKKTKISSTNEQKSNIPTVSPEHQLKATPEIHEDYKSHLFKAIHNSGPLYQKISLCSHGHVHHGAMPRLGMLSGKVVPHGKLTNMDRCIKYCCESHTCDVALMIGKECFSITCKSSVACQTAQSHFHRRTKMVYIYRKEKQKHQGTTKVDVSVHTQRNSSLPTRRPTHETKMKAVPLVPRSKAEGHVKDRVIPKFSRTKGEDVFHRKQNSADSILSKSFSVKTNDADYKILDISSSIKANSSHVAHLPRGKLNTGINVLNKHNHTGSVLNTSRASHFNCNHSPVLTNVILRDGMEAGTFRQVPYARNNLSLCISHCCKDETCHVVFMVEEHCFNVKCKKKALCQYMKRKVSSLTTTLVYMDPKRFHSSSTHMNFPSAPSKVPTGENNHPLRSDLTNHGNKSSQTFTSPREYAVKDEQFKGQIPKGRRGEILPSGKAVTALDQELVDRTVVKSVNISNTTMKQKSFQQHSFKGGSHHAEILPSAKVVKQIDLELIQHTVVNRANKVNKTMTKTSSQRQRIKSKQREKIINDVIESLLSNGTTVDKEFEGSVRFSGLPTSEIDDDTESIPQSIGYVEVNSLRSKPLKETRGHARSELINEAQKITINKTKDFYELLVPFMKPTVKSPSFLPVSKLVAATSKQKIAMFESKSEAEAKDSMKTNPILPSVNKTHQLSEILETFMKSPRTTFKMHVTHPSVPVKANHTSLSDVRYLQEKVTPELLKSANVSLTSVKFSLKNSSTSLPKPIVSSKAFIVSNVEFKSKEKEPSHPQRKIAKNRGNTFPEKVPTVSHSIRKSEFLKILPTKIHPSQQIKGTVSQLSHNKHASKPTISAVREGLKTTGNFTPQTNYSRPQTVKPLNLNMIKDELTANLSLSGSTDALKTNNSQPKLEHSNDNVTGILNGPTIKYDIPHSSKKENFSQHFKPQPPSSKVTKNPTSPYHQYMKKQSQLKHITPTLDKKHTNSSRQSKHLLETKGGAIRDDVAVKPSDTEWYQKQIKRGNNTHSNLAVKTVSSPSNSSFDRSIKVRYGNNSRYKLDFPRARGSLRTMNRTFRTTKPAFSSFITKITTKPKTFASRNSSMTSTSRMSSTQLSAHRNKHSTTEWHRRVTATLMPTSAKLTHKFSSIEASVLDTPEVTHVPSVAVGTREVVTVPASGKWTDNTTHPLRKPTDRARMNKQTTTVLHRRVTSTVIPTFAKLTHKVTLVKASAVDTHKMTHTPTPAVMTRKITTVPVSGKHTHNTTTAAPTFIKQIHEVSYDPTLTKQTDKTIHASTKLLSYSNFLLNARTSSGSFGQNIIPHLKVTSTNKSHTTGTIFNKEFQDQPRKTENNSHHDVTPQVETVDDMNYSIKDKNLSYESKHASHTSSAEHFLKSEKKEPLESEVSLNVLPTNKIVVSFPRPLDDKQKQSRPLDWVSTNPVSKQPKNFELPKLNSHGPVTMNRHASLSATNRNASLVKNSLSEKRIPDESRHLTAPPAVFTKQPTERYYTRPEHLLKVRSDSTKKPTKVSSQHISFPTNSLTTVMHGNYRNKGGEKYFQVSYLPIKKSTNITKIKVRYIYVTKKTSVKDDKVFGNKVKKHNHGTTLPITNTTQTFLDLVRSTPKSSLYTPVTTNMKAVEPFKATRQASSNAVESKHLSGYPLKAQFKHTSKGYPFVPNSLRNKYQWTRPNGYDLQRYLTYYPYYYTWRPYWYNQINLARSSDYASHIEKSQQSPTTTATNNPISRAPNSLENRPTIPMVYKTLKSKGQKDFAHLNHPSELPSNLLGKQSMNQFSNTDELLKSDTHRVHIKTKNKTKHHDLKHKPKKLTANARKQPVDSHIKHKMSPDVTIQLSAENYQLLGYKTHSQQHSTRSKNNDSSLSHTYATNGTVNPTQNSSSSLTSKAQKDFLHLNHPSQLPSNFPGKQSMNQFNNTNELLKNDTHRVHIKTKNKTKHHDLKHKPKQLTANARKQPVDFHIKHEMSPDVTIQLSAENYKLLGYKTHSQQHPTRSRNNDSSLSDTYATNGTVNTTQNSSSSLTSKAQKDFVHLNHPSQLPSNFPGKRFMNQFNNTNELLKNDTHRVHIKTKNKTKHHDLKHKPKQLTANARKQPVDFHIKHEMSPDVTIQLSAENYKLLDYKTHSQQHPTRSRNNDSSLSDTYATNGTVNTTQNSSSSLTSKAQKDFVHLNHPSQLPSNFPGKRSMNQFNNTNELLKNDTHRVHIKTKNRTKHHDFKHKPKQLTANARKQPVDFHIKHEMSPDVTIQLSAENYKLLGYKTHSQQRPTRSRNNDFSLSDTYATNGTVNTTQNSSSSLTSKAQKDFVHLNHPSQLPSNFPGKRSMNQFNNTNELLKNDTHRVHIKTKNKTKHHDFKHKPKQLTASARKQPVDFHIKHKMSPDVTIQLSAENYQLLGYKTHSQQHPTRSRNNDSSLSDTYATNGTVNSTQNSSSSLMSKAQNEFIRLNRPSELLSNLPVKQSMSQSINGSKLLKSDARGIHTKTTNKTKHRDLKRKPNKLRNEKHKIPPDVTIQLSSENFKLLGYQTHSHHHSTKLRNDSSFSHTHADNQTVNSTQNSFSVFILGSKLHKVKQERLNKTRDFLQIVKKLSPLKAAENVTLLSMTNAENNEAWNWRSRSAPKTKVQAYPGKKQLKQPDVTIKVSAKDFTVLGYEINDHKVDPKLKGGSNVDHTVQSPNITNNQKVQSKLAFESSINRSVLSPNSTDNQQAYQRAGNRSDILEVVLLPNSTTNSSSTSEQGLMQTVAEELNKTSNVTQVFMQLPQANNSGAKAGFDSRLKSTKHLSKPHDSYKTTHEPPRTVTGKESAEKPNWGAVALQQLQNVIDLVNFTSFTLDSKGNRSKSNFSLTKGEVEHKANDSYDHITTEDPLTSTIDFKQSFKGLTTVSTDLANILAGCEMFSVSTNKTLRAGVHAGNFRPVLFIKNPFDCFTKCCASSTCNFAMFYNDFCYLVQCYNGRGCELIPIKSMRNYMPILFKVRNVTRMSVSPISNLSQKRFSHLHQKSYLNNSGPSIATAHSKSKSFLQFLHNLIQNIRRLQTTIIRHEQRFNKTKPKTETGRKDSTIHKNEDLRHNLHNTTKEEVHHLKLFNFIKHHPHKPNILLPGLFNDEAMPAKLNKSIDLKFRAKGIVANLSQMLSKVHLQLKDVLPEIRSILRHKRLHLSSEDLAKAIFEEIRNTRSKLLQERISEMHSSDGPLLIDNPLNSSIIHASSGHPLTGRPSNSSLISKPIPSNSSVVSKHDESNLSKDEISPSHTAFEQSRKPSKLHLTTTESLPSVSPKRMFTCVTTEAREGVTLYGGQKAGDFTFMGKMDDFSQCAKLCCEYSGCDMVLMVLQHCYAVTCFSDKSCALIPSPHASDYNVIVAYVRKRTTDDLGQGGGRVSLTTHDVQPLVATMCTHSNIYDGETLKGGYDAGHFSYRGEVSTVDECIENCCDFRYCDLVFMIKMQCYLVYCYGRDGCQHVPAYKARSLHTRIIYLRDRHRFHPKIHGLENQETERSQLSARPTEHMEMNSNVSHNNTNRSNCSDVTVVKDATLKRGYQAGTFIHKGRKMTDDECIQDCCRNENCNLALMLQKFCFSVKCESATGCLPIKAKPSKYHPRIAYVRRLAFMKG